MSLLDFWMGFTAMSGKRGVPRRRHRTGNRGDLTESERMRRRRPLRCNANVADREAKAIIYRIMTDFGRDSCIAACAVRAHRSRLPAVNLPWPARPVGSPLRGPAGKAAPATAEIPK
ncbi:protein of unknown function [Cupriavidus taiwanensis]|nr:protein of unknown function [Cupriavidus taiwanensis]